MTFVEGFNKIPFVNKNLHQNCNRLLLDIFATKSEVGKIYNKITRMTKIYLLQRLSKSYEK